MKAKFIPQPQMGPASGNFYLYQGRKLPRPVRRRMERMEAFANITKKYPGESRSMRRRLAFDLVRNLHKKKVA